MKWNIQIQDALVLLAILSAAIYFEYVIVRAVLDFVIMVVTLLTW
jgi:hypothetical protein